MSDPTKSREKKDFWDISALVPQSKRGGYKLAPTRDVSATEVTAPPQNVGDEPKTYFVSRAYESELRTRPTPEREYTPGHPLLLAVRLYARESTPDWHDKFREQVLKLYPYEGKPCPRVGFFS